MARVLVDVGAQTGFPVAAQKSVECPSLQQTGSNSSSECLIGSRMQPISTMFGAPRESSSSIALRM
jgi:hypothetical protein